MRLYRIRKAVYFCEVFQCYAFHKCHKYYDEVIFSASSPFSGVALLNWFTKNSKFEEGFNNNELS